VTRRADLPESAISYRQYLQQRIADPLTICGPPIYDAPSLWQELFPILKAADLRELEHQVHEAELEVGL
jgi:hypothetical protein